MKRLSIVGVAIAALPPLLALAHFYSLAAHMYLSLGHWPNSIGYIGFSSALMLHGKVQFWLVKIVAVASVYVWPAGMVLCVIIPRARRFLPYFAIFALMVLVCFGLMQLAPKPFLDWWFD